VAHHFGKGHHGHVRAFALHVRLRAASTSNTLAREREAVTRPTGVCHDPEERLNEANGLWGLGKCQKLIARRKRPPHPTPLLLRRV
jgi:hypothetical protein